MYNSLNQPISCELLNLTTVLGTFNHSFISMFWHFVLSVRSLKKSSSCEKTVDVIIGYWVLDTDTSWPVLLK